MEGYGKPRPVGEIEAAGNHQLQEATGGYGKLLRLGAKIEATGNRRLREATGRLWQAGKRKLREAMGDFSALEPKSKPPGPSLKSQAETL